jgi:NADH-quinone oxidoreductase subunit J
MSPSLFSPEGLAGAIFLVLIGTTFIGALIATLSQRLIRSVIGLAVCFLGVAGIYYFLNSPFVALMELLIYVGAVCITIAFAIMLSDPEDTKVSRKYKSISVWVAAPLGLLIAFALGRTALQGHWLAPAEKINAGSINDLGMSLLNQYSMVFELISVVLLVAIIGSLALARVGRRKQ